MRKFVLLLSLLCGLAQAEEPKTPTDPLSELHSKFQAISPKLLKAGYTIQHIEFDRISKGTPYVITRPLLKGQKYKFVGVGLKSIGDLQLSLVDSKGKTLAKDPGADSVGIVNYVASQSGSFKVQVKSSTAEGQVYFFCLIASKPHKTDS